MLLQAHRSDFIQFPEATCANPHQFPAPNVDESVVTSTVDHLPLPILRGMLSPGPVQNGINQDFLFSSEMEVGGGFLESAPGLESWS